MISSDLNDRIQFHILAGMVFAIPLVFLPFQYDIYEWPKLSLFWAGILLTAIIQLFRFQSMTDFFQWLKNSFRRWSLFDVKTVFLCLILIYFVATWLSIKPLESFRGSVERSFGTVTIISFFIFFFLFQKHRFSKTDIHFLSKILILDSFIISLLAIAQKFWGFGLFGEIKIHGIVRPYGTFGHPNYLGAFLAIIFPYLLYAFTIHKQSIDRGLISLAVILNLFAIYLTLNRGGWLALFFGSLGFCLIYQFFHKNNKTPWHFWRHIIITIIIHVLILTSFISGLWGLGGRERQDDLTVDSGSIYLRIQEAKFAWSKIQERPWFGYGPETYYYLSLARVIPEKEQKLDGALADRVHNWFLDQWITIGIFGLLSWIIIYSYFIKQSWRKLWQSQQTLFIVPMTSLLAYVVLIQFHFDTTIILFLVFLNFIIIQSSEPEST